ncbi:histidinol-phosphate transaminase [Wenxinia marina]|uniref:Histidinol-phosphate aminotransferase n=1 Tax=Wenxinia marina DSM 24838 TaxID=1123501 RepID=A0A0D0QAR3_9RHOB|nr:histidinol-phosphate transaminase [Wenxinia marina]KIQ68048.1 histidinol-phosphate aminotransferase [Wenxinia marina DSM 24838]GGL75115.1 histidinol-phosphate aminotransferase [Wenxinia marina]
MTDLTPQPGIMEIALYVGGEAKIAGRDEALKLSANENPFGAGDAARAAFAAASRELHRYPSTDHAGLRAAIGEVHGIDPARVICGVGSDEVLQFVTQAYAGPGDEVILTRHGFSLYPILARAAGATPVSVDERERVVDVDAILSAVTDRTRVVFLTNPGNPTGTVLPPDEVVRLAEGLAGRAILVHDGAYSEFAGDGFDGGLGLADAFPHVVATRTFSKIYGLGGLRIGWGYASRAIVDVLNRLRQPFNLSTAQLAAAEAAVRDQAWVEWCRAENAKMRTWLTGKVRALGLGCDDSYTNFLLVRFADEAAALAADAALREDGILVRRVAGYGFPQALRVTVGDEVGCHRVADSLARHLGAK